MISLTPYGKTRYQKSIEKLPTAVHLFIESGELKGYGYEAKVLKASEWVDGQYPELVWEFESEREPAFVMGYYVTDETGQVLFSDQFDQSYKIRNQGDRIGVSINMRFIGAIGS